ncbi:MAG: class I SAM-dependent methyltransferase [Nanoarchaeota archaeon]
MIEEYDVFIDSIIDWKKRIYHEMSFYEHLFAKHHVKTLLDLRCGSGHLLGSLSHLVKDAVGAERNAHLVKGARELTKLKQNVTILHSSLDQLKSELAKTSAPQIFSCIMLLNNHLPSIINDENFINYLRSIHNLLEKQGIVIFSLFNYHRVLMDGEYDFGTIPAIYEGTPYTLLRYMKVMDSDLIKYSADVFDRHNNEALSYQQLLKPLTKARLENYLFKAGFVEPEFYGDFSFNPFSPERSRRMLVVVKRNQRS